MNPDKLFSLLSPKQVLSQESQQAYQSKVDTAKAENKMIKEKVVNPFFSFADKSFKKIMEVLNPGESYVAPALKNIGVNPILAGGIGLGVDILAPGPGELGRVAKVGKEAKVGSELLQEAKKYKSAEEFVKAKTRNFGLPTRDVASDIYKNVYTNEKPQMFEVSKLYPTETQETRKLLGAENFSEKIAGKKITEPIVITEKGTILDGHNRYYQALVNGDKEIPVYILKDSSVYKSQLTDIWNQANKKTK